MQPAARLGDKHTCPMMGPGGDPHVGGPIVSGEPAVLVANMPVARIGDTASCVGPTDTIVTGRMLVQVGNRPVACVGDLTVHGGVIVQGANRVLIGDGGAGAGGSTGATMRAARADGSPFCDVSAEGQGEP